MSSGMDFNERCLREGADAFILKPYMPDDLVRTIRQALEK
jgi:CheY-like chemotaxis protein